MKIPRDEYTFDAFLDYLVKNESEVFHSGDRKQWLKVYFVHSKRNWRDLFQSYPIEPLGKIFKIAMETGDQEKKVEYYVHELGPGILMFFTSSRREEYEKTLKRFIDSSRGISELWIPPNLFSEVRNHLLANHKATIYKFISRRNLLTETNADMRPNYDRRLSYTGEDATIVLKEVLQWYGVIPESISFRVQMQEMQITSNGMILFLSVNDLSIIILKELMVKLTEAQIKVNDVCSSLRRETRLVHLGRLQVPTPVVVPGIIRLQSRELDREVVERFLRRKSVDIIEVSSELEINEELDGTEFSFIDPFIREGSFSFSATVVDDLKGSMFGISGSSTEIVLVPMHRTTFESFMRFYQLVIENLDKEASFDVLSPETGVQ